MRSSGSRSSTWMPGMCTVPSSVVIVATTRPVVAGCADWRWSGGGDRRPPQRHEEDADAETDAALRMCASGTNVAAPSGSRSNPTSFQPGPVRRKNARTGVAHDGCAASIALMSTRTNEPSALAGRTAQSPPSRVAAIGWPIGVAPPSRVVERKPRDLVRGRRFCDARGDRRVPESQRA